MLLDLKLLIVLYLICCKTQFLVLLVTFNLSSTQFYLFFSSFRIKNYKLYDQLPPPDFSPPLIRRGTSGPRNSLSKSNPYIISCQIRYSEWWNNRNRNFKDKNQGIDNHGGVFSGTRLWEFGDIIFPTDARCHKRGYVAGATMRPLPCLWNNPDVKPCAGCVPWLWYKFSHTEEGAPPPLAGGALGVLPSAESSCSGIWERASCAEASCLSCEGGGCRAGNGPTPVWRHHHTSFKRTSHEVSPFLM